MTDYYHDCLGRIGKSSAISYLNCLLPFFGCLEEESHYQGNKVRWNDSEEKIHVVVEDYLMHEMQCKIRDKDNFCFVNLTNKSPNTISRFLSALKSFYKSMIRLKQYHFSNPLIDGQAILHSYKEEIKGIHINTIKRNEELYEQYKKHSRTYKIKNARKKPEKPSTFDESTLRRISPNRDSNKARKKYMQLSKEELVKRLIEVEQYVAENQQRWVSNQFEQFKLL